MKKRELIQAIESVPDNALIALNVGFDSDNVSICTRHRDRYGKHLVEGWNSKGQETPALCPAPSEFMQ